MRQRAAFGGQKDIPMYPQSVNLSDTIEAFYKAGKTCLGYQSTENNERLSRSCKGWHRREGRMTKYWWSLLGGQDENQFS